MDELTHYNERINGLDYHFVTLGSGPAILFLHGFPDLWLGWRPIMERFAQAGYMAIAPDLRGFGESQAAAGADQATAFDVLGDLIGILDHLGIERAGLVAHDWGAAVAWPIIQLRPDRFHAIAALSVPYQPHGPLSMIDFLKANAPPDLYLLYFLEEGLAEQELDADPARFLRQIVYSNSGEAPGDAMQAMRLAENGRLIDALYEPDGEVTCFPEEHVAIYADAFAKTGFRGALNTYRSLHRTWELMAGWADLVPTVPACFLVGERDVSLAMLGGAEGVRASMQCLPQADEPIILEGLGHFIQFEAPDLVADLLLDFYARIPQA